jgi:hypothetical protein
MQKSRGLDLVQPHLVAGLIPKSGDRACIVG